jgi:hypothetical protein
MLRPDKLSSNNACRPGTIKSLRQSAFAVLMRERHMITNNTANKPFLDILRPPLLFSGILCVRYVQETINADIFTCDLACAVFQNVHSFGCKGLLKYVPFYVVTFEGAAVGAGYDDAPRR